jgi:hypothetical protein
MCSGQAPAFNTELQSLAHAFFMIVIGISEASGRKKLRLLVALSGHFQLHLECPLLGGKAEVARTHVEVRL